MKIYLDACCLNRLTDDQSQPRIREEAGAVERILKLVRDGIVSMDFERCLADEIDRNPDPERKSGNLALLAFTSEIVEENNQIARRPRCSTEWATACLTRCTWLVPKQRGLTCCSRLMTALF
jgi:hypothetical protein